MVKNGVAQIQFITLGAQKDGIYEILSGLSFGDIVVTTNPKRAYPNAKLRIKQ